MESLSPTHPISPTIEQQKVINRETSVVELPPASPVGQHDADRGASASSDAFTPAAAQVPAAPALSTISTSPVTLLSPLQRSSPTQAEIDAHPIRRRLSPHGEHIAATGWAQNSAEQERQEQLQGLSVKAGAQSTEGNMAEVKEGDKGRLSCDSNGTACGLCDGGRGVAPAPRCSRDPFARRIGA